MRSPSVRENNWGNAGRFVCLLGSLGGHFGLILVSFGAFFGGLEAQMAGERRLREVLGRSGSSPEAVWGVSWAVLGAHWSHLGPSWGHQGQSWGRLGAILGRLGGPLGLSKGLREPPWRSEGES